VRVCPAASARASPQNQLTALISVFPTGKQNKVIFDLSFVEFSVSLCVGVTGRDGARGVCSSTCKRRPTNRSV
jgi:hypothetical protein